MLNTETLTQLLTDPELREKIPQLLRRKIQADATSVEANAYVAKHLIDLVRRTGNGSAAAAALRAVFKDYLDFYETLVNLQLTFNNTLMEKLERLSESPEPARSSNTVTMNLSAAHGSVVRMPFRIENNRSTDIPVGFETTSFVSEDGAHLVATEAAFDPPALDLRPQQEARIQFILPVGDQFRLNTTYLSTVTVRGLDGPHLLVRLNVQPKQEPAVRSPSGTDGEAVQTTASDGQMTKSPRSKKRAAAGARRSRRAKTTGRIR